MTRKRITILIVLIAGLFAFSGCGNANKARTPSTTSASPAPVKTTEKVDMNGTWKADGFEAVITDNNIVINIVGDDESESLYWVGTFPAGTNHIQSAADVEALSMAIMGSQETTKPFTLKGDDLSFKFSMMGSSMIVHMKKA